MQDEQHITDLDQIRAEVERAAGYYYHTPLQQGIDNRTRSFVIEKCAPYLRGPACLEFGYVDGLWTDHLLGSGLKVDIVEGAPGHVEHARSRYKDEPDVVVHHSLFQEFQAEKKYDTILCGDMLRYVEDPVAFLSTCGKWLNPEGRIIVTVPNSRSLHRRIGTFLNMEPTPVAANLRDREVGNQRSYDRYELRSQLLAANLNVCSVRGCFLKPLSSAQMADWDDALLRAFSALGEELEDYCWFLYAVAKNRRVAS